MIRDVPTAKDFLVSGSGFLNLAWDSTLSLAINLDDAREWGNITGRVSDRYWRAAQRPLATAIALAQQGIEFLLKAKIAEVSPFLLVAGSPREWPRGCDQQDVSFADFRTIDAQDLVRAHDTVSPQRLSEVFKGRLNELRRMRNTIMHTVDRRLRVTPAEVILAILEASDSLIQPMGWVQIRRAHLEKDERSAAWAGSPYAPNVVARELDKAFELLTPVQSEQFFGLKRQQRRYRCHSCYLECDDDRLELLFAQLRPNMPTAKTIFCIMCQGEYSVHRRPCTKPGCRGNVIEANTGVCLTCGMNQEPR